MTTLLQMYTAIHTIKNRGTEGFLDVERLVDMEMAVALLVCYTEETLKKPFSKDSLLDEEHLVEKVSSALEECLPPAVFRIFNQPHKLFYVNENYVFDNFSAFAILVDGVLWPTVEHAYQAAKFDDRFIIDRIRHATSPHEAKKIAHEPDNVLKIRPTWKDEKIPFMAKFIRLKTAQHSYVKKKLLESKGYLIIENSPTDGFWGRGPDWKGENWLGELWMTHREELLLEES